MACFERVLSLAGVKSRRFMGSGMSKILDGVYIGNFYDSKEEKAQKENQVTHILAVHDNAKPLLADKVYLCIFASDNPQQCLSQYFEESIDFIHKARQEGGGVLIHCLSGVSRSVTLTVAYIMTITSLSWRESMNAIRGARNCANPNYGFQKQLREYEENGLEAARKRLKEKYPDYDNKKDEQRCQELLKCYQHYLAHGSHSDVAVWVYNLNEGKKTSEESKSCTDVAKTKSNET
ncbi:dual specificity protein phosphatase 22-B [Octopus bimaculoides]|uniref:Dual specificity protein phosphatase 15 n=1 Tax=Octopus bimaculoides TaxID=37653 RepID=A0A0L8H857_OCTBM|nr:dual specificity protein phosphatase 22-B [Octopus bimaculoides]|eukprot:XP_014774669.1 PREDICTED: dual specificity protein phosphatase 22-B-like [Octopus bimaculoides]